MVITIQPIIALIAGLANIILGIIVLRKNTKSPNNIWFFLMCLFGGSWGVTKAIQLSLMNIYWHDLIISKLVMFLGILAPFAFLMLTYHFPYKTKIFSKRLQFTIYLIPAILLILTLTGVFEYMKAFIMNGDLNWDVVLFDYSIFSIYFFLYVLCGFVILLKKHFKSGGYQKIQIKYLMIATISTFITIGFVSIILVLFNNFRYDWMGALFMMIHFTVLSYYLFYRFDRLR